MRKRWLLLFWISLFAPHFVRAEVMSDAEFFASLDLSDGALAPVQSALEAGDTLTAKAELQAYYQNRTSQQYFPLRVWGDDKEATDALNHYFTLVGERLHAEEEDGSIDWSMRFAGDDEWHWQFHRMYWLPEMAGLYFGTGDEKWAEGWMDHVRDWILENPPGYPRTLDTANRLRAWVESYQLLVHARPSPSIDAEDHTLILKSLIEQARFLRANWKQDGNWGASESFGLGSVVAMFPEFRFTPDGSHDEWVDLVISRLEHHLRSDFLPDGVQYEVSPMYHTYEYRNLVNAYRLLVMNGAEIEDDFLELFLRPGRYLMYLSRPDGLLPPVSDSDRITNHVESLAAVGELLDQPDFQYVVGRGSSGTPPAETFMAFPDGGVIVMRSDWGTGPDDFDRARHFVLDYGSNQPWHAHYDALSFEAYAYGRGIIRDPGRYTYGTSGGWRNYFKGTPNHNTITVDGRNQAAIAGGQAEWCTAAGLDFVRAWHESYPGLRHERVVLFVRPEYWIIFDRVTGNGSHTYDLNFQFEAGLPVRLDEETNATLSSAFTLMPADRESTPEVRTAWVSNSYGSREEAPAVRYTKSGTPPVTFESVLYPYPARRMQITTTALDARDGSGRDLARSDARALEVEFATHTDVAILNDAGIDSIVAGTLGLEAEAAFVRRDDEGIVRYDVVHGRSLSDGDRLLLRVEGGLANVSVDGVRADFQGTASRLTAWAPAATEVTMNGEAVDFDRSGEYIVAAGNAVNVIPPASSPQREAMLAGNFPNPFTATTTIRFSLQHPGFVKMEVFDVLGRRVRTLVSGERAAGVHDVQFSADDLAPGVYYYRLASGDAVESRQMILLK